MKINFNKDNITKYIIRGIILIMVTTGYKLYFDTKCKSKFVNTKNLKKYEEINSNIQSYYCVQDGYHLSQDGHSFIKNDCFEKANNRIFDAHTKAIPYGYHLELTGDDSGYIIPNNCHIEVVNSSAYIVSNDYCLTIKNDNIESIKIINDESENKDYNYHIEMIDNTTYKVYNGYHLEKENDIIVPINDSEIIFNGYIYHAPYSYTLENVDGHIVAFKKIKDSIEPSIYTNEFGQIDYQKPIVIEIDQQQKVLKMKNTVN